MIENMQRHATRLVPGLETLDYKNRRKELKLPTLSYRLMRGDLIEVYKMFSDDLKNWFNTAIPTEKWYHNMSKFTEKKTNVE